MHHRDGNPIPHGDAITVTHEHTNSHGNSYAHRHAITHADVDPNAVSFAYPESDRLAHWNAIIGCLPVAHEDRGDEFLGGGVVQSERL